MKRHQGGQGISRTNLEPIPVLVRKIKIILDQVIHKLQSNQLKPKLRLSRIEKNETIQ